MPTLPTRAAAYTRTNVLKRFAAYLRHLDGNAPARVDNRLVEEALALKGGDVRAFLQSVRVLGLADPYGRVTERGMRLATEPDVIAVLQEGLLEAYPELTARWRESGWMTRDLVTKFFVDEYGLAPSTAGPAAKLFEDLMRDPIRPARSQAGAEPAAPVAISESPKSPPHSPPPDVRLAALAALPSFDIRIDASWDEKRITLVFDRLQQLVDRLLRAG